MDRDEQMLEPNENIQSTVVWYKTLSLYGTAGCFACFLLLFIYKVWHLAFYCHVLICLVVNSLLLQRTMGNTVKKRN